MTSVRQGIQPAAIAAPDGLDAFLKITPIQHVKCGGIISTGSARLYLVLNGLVRAYRDINENRSINMALRSNGGFLGEGSVVGEESNQIAAIEDSELMSWSPGEVLAVLKRHHGARAAFDQILADGMNELKGRFIEQRCFMPKRLPMALLRLDRCIGQPGDGPSGFPRVLPPLTHQVIADDVGTSREIATQYMGKLRRAGAIEYSRRRLAIYPDRVREILKDLVRAKVSVTEHEHA